MSSGIAYVAIIALFAYVLIALSILMYTIKERKALAPTGDLRKKGETGIEALFELFEKSFFWPVWLSFLGIEWLLGQSKELDSWLRTKP